MITEDSEKDRMKTS